MIPVVDLLCTVTTGSPYGTVAAETEDLETEDPHPRIPSTVSKSSSKKGQY